MPSQAGAAVSLSGQAYAKIVLHSAKYPASTVRGLLVGRPAAASSAASTSAFDVVDIIPLVHNWTDLSPITEVGCALAQAHVASASPLGASIVGLYEAPASMGVRELSRAAVKLARKIAGHSSSQGKGALLLLVNNALLLSPSSGHALLPFFLASAQDSAATTTTEPSPLPSSSTVLTTEAATIAAVTNMVQEGLAERFFDFDDHLADTRQDWLANSVPISA